MVVYRDKVYGSWLGQIIGNMYGLPYEFKYIDEAGPEPAFDPDYLAKLPRKFGGAAFDDDDTLLELVNLGIVEAHGFDPTPVQIAAGWTSRLKGGVYVANQRALELMRKGTLPPATSDPAVNPFSPWNLAGQFTQEIWGLLAPGMSPEAQRLADLFARVPVHGEAVLAAHWVAILHAEAFAETDVERLLRTATEALPKESAYRRILDDVLAWSAASPDDWRPVRVKIHEKYFARVKKITDQPPPGRWHQNSCFINGAMCALALRYGKGDLDRTLAIACAAGDDADCNAASILGVLGVIHGASGIPDRWKAPLNDRYRILYLEGYPSEIKISETAARIAAAGERLILAQGGRKEGKGPAAVYLIPRRPPHPVPLAR